MIYDKDDKKMVSYADDTTLCFSSENKNDLIRNVKTDLARLIENLDHLSLKVKVGKTKLLLLSNWDTNNFPDVKTTGDKRRYG